MAAPKISQYARVVVDAVIATYDTGASYNTVSRKLSQRSPPIEVSTSAVQAIMRRFSPGSIRAHGRPPEVRLGPTLQEGMTLAALGQSRVDPCRSCGIPLVAETRENPVKGQTCGLCVDFAGGGGPARKAAGAA